MNYTHQHAESRSTLKVALADDHDMVRAGMAALLARMPGIHVVGEARDGEELLALLAGCETDVVLCDLRMPRMDGLQALEHIRARHPAVRVVMLTMHEAAGFMRRAVERGASGYLLKDAAPEELEHTLRTVSRSGSYFGSDVTRALMAGPADDPLQALNATQTQILARTAEGRSCKEIGHALGLSAKTVNAQRARLMARLGLRDVASLTRYALRAGLVETAR